MKLCVAYIDPKFQGRSRPIDASLVEIMYGVINCEIIVMNFDGKEQNGMR